MRISIVIPFLNEKENLAALSEALTALAKTPSLPELEVIFVDDGSTDGSSDYLNTLTHAGYIGRLVILSKNYGSHAALRAGFSVATGDYMVNTNADLQDPPELIPLLLEKCLAGADIAWAHRTSNNLAFTDRLFSLGYALLVRKLVNPEFPKMGLDIVMFNQRVRHELDQRTEANSSLFLQIMNFGFRQDKIFFERKNRTRGKSKWTFMKKVKLLLDTFIAFSYAPIRLVSAVGILFSILGFIWTLYIILRELLYHDLASGWPALVSILLIGFGITNLSLGIIAEYLWRTLDASRNRKVYIIDKQLDLNSVR